MNKIANNSDKPIEFFSNLKKVVTGTGFSRFFGLARDISTTNLLGASIFHDIFVICLKIPNLFRRFFAEGAFNQAFIPIYAEYEQEKDDLKTNDFLYPYYRDDSMLLGIGLQPYDLILQLLSLFVFYSNSYSKLKA